MAKAGRLQTKDWVTTALQSDATCYGFRIALAAFVLAAYGEDPEKATRHEALAPKRGEREWKEAERVCCFCSKRRDCVLIGLKELIT